MIAPAALAIFAVLVNSLGARWLRRARWVDRAPALGIIVWQALTASVLFAFSLAGLALALPLLPGTTSLATLIEACSSALRNQYQTPGGTGISIAGFVLTIGIGARVGYCAVAAMCTIRRNRKAQNQNLALTAERDTTWKISVVDHPTPAVYCIPGRTAGVVVTTGAQATLNDGQLGAVIAHERAHLRGRHDLVLACAEVLHRAFPRLACARIGHSELARLVEMRADDIALRSCDRITLAWALVNLSAGPAPAGALGASGAALARLHRLTKAPRPVGWMTYFLATTATTVLLVVPLLIVSEPAAVVAMMHYCPIDI